MRRHLFILAAAAVLCMPVQNIFSQTPAEERQRRLKEHQARVRQILDQARETRERAKRFENVTATDDPGTTASKDSAASGHESDAEARDDRQERARWMEGWRRFWTFYRTPLDNEKTVELQGAEQEYANDFIRLRWSLGDDDDEKRTTRTLSYEWLGTTGTETRLDLPREGGRLLLQNGRHSVEVKYGNYGNNLITLTQRELYSNYFAASRVSAPYADSGTLVTFSGMTQGYAASITSFDINITKKHGQVINDWVIYLQEGSVYAQEIDTSGSIRIGTKVKDFRPIGNMTVSIDYLDHVTSAAKVIISDAYYPKTLFATDKSENIRRVFEKVGGMQALKFDALHEFAQTYNFRITWADEETRRLAMSQVVSSDTMNSTMPVPVLRQLERLLGDDFVAIAEGPDELRIELSNDYRASQELPELAAVLQADYKLETKLLLVNRISAHQAMAIIERDLLGCYFIGKPAATDVTSDTLKVKGTHWAILKRPLSQENEIRKRLEKNGELKNAIVCESIDNAGMVTRQDGGEAIVITATAETHERIRTWLERIESEVKEASLGAAEGDAVPERRRLQMVLLQGGKAGEAAAVADEHGTSVTYQADVPAQFGMTPEDLKILGFDGAVVVGRGVVDLVANPGDAGAARLTLGGQYMVSVQYQQEQGGFLLVEGALERAAGGDDNKPLAQNTMMLKKGEPAFLGVTNLAGAVIAVVTWIN